MKNLHGLAHHCYISNGLALNNIMYLMAVINPNLGPSALNKPESNLSTPRTPLVTPLIVGDSLVRRAAFSVDISSDESIEVQ